MARRPKESVAAGSALHGDLHPAQRVASRGAEQSEDVYNILFRASSQALQKLALDPRFIGGRIGMVGVLHTWTPDLRYHPEDGMVTFKYKESATDEIRFSDLPAEEFIRRFLQHVLPERFVKVRYYGLLSPSNRHLLNKARELLGATVSERGLQSRDQVPLSEGKARRCPECGDELTLVRRLGRHPREPP